MLGTLHIYIFTDFRLTNKRKISGRNLLSVNLKRVGSSLTGEENLKKRRIFWTENLDWRGNATRTSTYTDAGAASVWTVAETPGSAQPSVQKAVAGYAVSVVSSTAVQKAIHRMVRDGLTIFHGHSGFCGK